jgi:hypothetical protein
MADRRALEDPGAAGESPVLVQITVETRARRNATAGPVRPVGRFAPVIAVVLIALLVVAVVGMVGGRRTGAAASPHHTQVAQASTPGPVGVAAAYRYPRGCLDVTIAAADPAYAAVRLNRVSPCWRYGVYVTAVFHRVGGVWRMMLEAAGTGCPMPSVPAAVRAQLDLCEKDGAATPAAMESRSPSHPDARPRRAHPTPEN